jgi:cytochrome c biogenesis protein CcmG/thiol:disulfide interchange protein DsbE
MLISLKKIIFLIFITTFFGYTYATNFIGTPLPNFKLVDIMGGQQLTNADLPKPPFLVHFWATWCAACDKDTASMIDLAKKYPIIGVVVRDDIEDDINWLEVESHPYTVLLNDETAEFAQKMNVNFLPTTFLIDKDNKIAQYNEGAIHHIEIFSIKSEPF